jgi:hypothetical protein
MACIGAQQPEGAVRKMPMQPFGTLMRRRLKVRAYSCNTDRDRDFLKAFNGDATH